MGWISRGFSCEACGLETIALCERDEPVPNTYPCEHCTAAAVYKISASIAQVSHPDGTTHRFSSLKETRKLQKIKKKAFYKRDKDTYLRASHELTKVK